MNKLSLKPKDILNKLQPVLRFLRRYLKLIVFVVVIGTYSFLIFRINSLLNAQPSEAEVSERLLSVKRPKVDQNAVNKLQQLQDQNVQVHALFQQARDNPFFE